MHSDIPSPGEIQDQPERSPAGDRARMAVGLRREDEVKMGGMGPTTLMRVAIAVLVVGLSLAAWALIAKPPVQTEAASGCEMDTSMPDAGELRLEFLRTSSDANTDRNDYRLSGTVRWNSAAALSCYDDGWTDWAYEHEIVYQQWLDRKIWNVQQDFPDGAGFYIDTTASDGWLGGAGTTGMSFGIFRPERLEAGRDYHFSFETLLPRQPDAGGDHLIRLWGEVVEKQCSNVGPWCAGLDPTGRRYSADPPFIGDAGKFSTTGSTCVRWALNDTPASCGRAEPPAPTTAPSPTAAPETAPPAPTPTAAPETAPPAPAPTAAPETAPPAPAPTAAPETAPPTPAPTAAPETAPPTPAPTAVPAVIDRFSPPCRDLLMDIYPTESFGGWESWAQYLDPVAAWFEPIEMTFRYPTGLTSGTVALVRATDACAFQTTPASYLGPGDVATVQSFVGEPWMVQGLQGGPIYWFQAGDGWTTGSTAGNEFLLPRPQIEWNRDLIVQCYEYDCDFRDA